MLSTVPVSGGVGRARAETRRAESRARAISTAARSNELVEGRPGGPGVDALKRPAGGEQPIFQQRVVVGCGSQLQAVHHRGRVQIGAGQLREHAFRAATAQARTKPS